MDIISWNRIFILNHIRKNNYEEIDGIIANYILKEENESDVCDLLSASIDSQSITTFNKVFPLLSISSLKMNFYDAVWLICQAINSGNYEILVKIIENLYELNVKNNFEFNEVIIKSRDNSYIEFSRMTKNVFDGIETIISLNGDHDNFNFSEILIKFCNYKYIRFFRSVYDIDQLNDKPRNYPYTFCRPGKINTLNLIYTIDNIFVNLAIDTNNNKILKLVLNNLNNHIPIGDNNIYIFLSKAIELENIDILIIIYEYFKQYINKNDRLWVDLIVEAIFCKKNTIFNYIFDKFYILNHTNEIIIQNNNIEYLFKYCTNIEIEYKIFINLTFDITTDLLYHIINNYKVIISNGEETFQSLLILDKIFEKIIKQCKNDIITQDFYIRFCNVISYSLMFIVDKLQNNTDSKSILTIILQDFKFNLTEIEKLIPNLLMKKKILIKKNQINTDIKLFITSFCCVE